MVKCTSILVHSLTFIDNYQVILKGRGPYLRGRGPVLCIISLKFCHTNSKKYLQKTKLKLLNKKYMQKKPILNF